MSSSSNPPDIVPSRLFGLLMKRLSMEPSLARLFRRQSVPLAARSPIRNP